MDPASPAWLVIAVSVFGLVGTIITAVVGPMIVGRRKSGQTTAESPESAVTTQLVGSAVKLIQSAIDDLQDRVGQLETMQLKDGP